MASKTNARPSWGPGARDDDLPGGSISPEFYTQTGALLKRHPEAHRLSAFDGTIFLGAVLDTGRSGCFAIAPDGNIGAFRGRREAVRSLPAPVGRRA